MSFLSRNGITASNYDFEVKKALRTLLQVDTVAAAGSSQTDATALTAHRNLVTAADGTKCVILPTAEIDQAITVVNTVAGEDLPVYPNTSAQINALTATSGAFTVPGGTEVTFYCDALLHWYVRAGTVSSTYDATTGITAYASGGQASATALTSELNNVTTCATAGDSVKLPAAALGKRVKIKNSGATSLAVFPATGDSINALAVNLSVNIPVGGVLTFDAISDTVWETNEAMVLSAPTTQSGELVIKAADNAADHEIVVVNASHGQATTHTIPDPGGATASFVITEGAQTINGAKTFSSALKTSSGVGAIAGSGVTVAESGDGVVHQSVFTFDYTGANDFDLADGADHGTGRKFYDFPEGRILVLGATCNLSFTATNAGNGGATYPFGIGTATAGDEGTLAGTEQDIIPSTAVAFNGGAAQAVGAPLAASAHFDGTGTAKDLFFNVAVTDVVSSAAVTVAATGTVTVTWINLGDYA